MINVLVQYSDRLVKIFNTLGIMGFIRFVRQNIGAPWLDPVWVEVRLARPFQLRLI